MYRPVRALRRVISVLTPFLPTILLLRFSVDRHCSRHDLAGRPAALTAGKTCISKDRHLTVTAAISRQLITAEHDEPLDS